VGCLESFAAGVCIIGTSLHRIDQIGIGSVVPSCEITFVSAVLVLVGLCF
jgi:hypothetical protein